VSDERKMPESESVALTAKNIADAQRARGGRPDEAAIRGAVAKAKERGDQIRSERGKR
jgi:hypothetical protein